MENNDLKISSDSSERNIHLRELFAELSERFDAEISSDFPDIEISDVTSDSRRVHSGSVFVAIKGISADGHRYIGDAQNKGASALVIQHGEIVENINVPVAIVPDTREALVILLKKFFCKSPKKLFAVTGTNGKTTVSHILWHIFTEAGEKAGIIGTLGYAFENGVLEKLSITTPDAESLWRLLDKMEKKGITAVAMEASSHGIHQKRIYGLDFDAAIYTNLTQDHLDYHGNMENYLSAKCALFEELPLSSTAVVNIDDNYSKQVIDKNRGELLTYAIENSSADIVAEIVKMNITGSVFKMRSPFGNFDVHTKLPGKFNVYNILAALGATMARGYNPEIAISAVEKIEHIKGRFQRIENGQLFTVIVDYAHTPDALKNLITTARELSKGRVIVVFGAGGDRDHSKRAIMGKIAAQFADLIIITSDNPRSEDPMKIIDMIKTGIPERVNYRTIPDRREAIFTAVEIAQSGDIILIAGKGHEDYQILADRTIHFDDAEVVSEAISERIRR